MAVSIHTRHYWRVKRRQLMACPARKGFNPHPPLLAGETALLMTPGDTCPSFNPHPPLLAGETAHVLRAAHVVPFQSTPAITGG